MKTSGKSATESQSLFLLADDNSNTIQAMTRAMAKDKDSAWRWFFEHYYPRLLRYHMEFFKGNHALANDAAQDTLKRVVRYIKPFEKEEDLWRWLCSVAKSAAVDYVRKDNRYRIRLSLLVDQNGISEPTAPQVDPANAPVALLQRCLDALSTRERALIESHYFDGISYRAMADSSELSERGVENRIYRIRKKLKRLLIKEMEVDGA